MPLPINISELLNGLTTLRAHPLVKSGSKSLNREELGDDELENVPENPGNDPENLGNDPENLGNDPENLGNEPENLENEPENLENEPENLENEPENLENEPENTENEPENRIGIVLLAIIKKPEITIQELSRIVNVNKSTIKRDLEKLRSQNKIKRVGSDKGGYWAAINL